MKRLLLVLAVAVALVATSCGSSGSGGASSSAAVVNGSTITMEQLNAELEDVALAYFGPVETMDAQTRDRIYGTGEGTYSAAFTAQVLQSLIVNQLIVDEVEARGITPSATDQQTASTAVKSQFEQSAQTAQQQGGQAGQPSAEYTQVLVDRQAAQVALDAALAAEKGTTGVTDEDVRAYYDKNIDQITSQNGEFACASHILIGWTENPDPNAEVTPPTPEQDAAALARAQDIEAQLAAGGDFAELATTSSADPGSATKGGDLGCKPLNDSGYVPEFEDAVKTQPVGEIGPPVKSDYGYHIIVVRSRGVLPFEEVAADIRQILEEQASGDSAALSAWVSDAAKNMTVDINPQFGTWTDQGLVPPEGASTQTTIAPEGGTSDELPVDLSGLTSQGG